MPPTLAVGSRIVGRELELERLHEPVRVAFVHGIPGIGKSALLDAFLADRPGVVRLDCRSIEPTERGFLSALGPSMPESLALDHYEVFRLMDTWLRQVFVPALPEGTRIVLAGREPPVASWFAVEGFRSLPLGPLSDADALLLLDRREIRAADAPRLNAIARGHPLALMLASAGAAEHPELGLEEAATTRVIAELARLYLEAVEDPATQRALEAASVVRRATEPLLAAMLTGEDAADAMSRLLDLPFVDAGRDGLVLHDAVRQSIEGFVRATNPVRHREYRRTAWRELRSEVRDASPSELWRYTADMLYLIDNPVVREAFFPTGSQPLVVEPARADDTASLLAIARRHEGVAGAALLERWWEQEPDTFSVTRDRDGVVVGFFSLLDTSRILPPAVSDDPVTAAWAQHLRDHPLPRGQQALGLRRWLDAEHGEGPCASQGACWVDVKRAYMALRPALRRMYVTVTGVPTYWPVVERLGFRPIAEQGVVVDGTEYFTVVLDFGPGSVDGWLAGLAAAELGLSDDPDLDEDARELSVAGEAVTLTPLELGLFSHLRAREGKAVSRAELLHEVWATDYAGGSNVVDAVVRSLRGKLGPAAAVVETVRGSGYRLRSDWRAHLG
jgi:hypothetical protein